MNSRMRKQYPIPIRDNTPEEEAEAQRQRLMDPDALEFTGENVVDRPPPHLRGKANGGAKRCVSVSLDGDLIDALKALDPQDWQGRLNAIARSSLGM